MSSQSGAGRRRRTKLNADENDVHYARRFYCWTQRAGATAATKRRTRRRERRQLERDLRRNED